MIKKMASVLVSLLIVFFSLIPAFSVNDEVVYPLSEEPFQSEYVNSLNKLHFYFSSSDFSDSGDAITLFSNSESKTNDHLYIDNKNELDSAINTMNSYHKKYAETNESVIMTIEFKSNYEKTEEYKNFLKKRETVETIEELRSFREKMISFSKSYHENVVSEKFKIIEQFNYDAVETIDYSPFVRVAVNKDEVIAEKLIDIVNDDDIVNISFSLSDEIVNETAWNRTMREIGAYTTINSSTYTGEGIKIGVLEAAVCEPDHENLDDINITIEPGYNNDTLTGTDDEKARNIAHANKVTSIIALMAPKAQIYASRNVDNGLAWFISKGCDIVNCSYGHTNTNKIGENLYEFDFGKAVYDFDRDGVFDYQIKANLITVVKSAGNIVSDNSSSQYNPYGYITSPGLGYNVITVGGLDCSLGFFDYDLEHNSKSAYVTSATSTKPEISALFTVDIPNIGEYSGTSYAAPQVTGTIALIMCKYVKSALNPYAIKAMLVSGAKETTGFSNIGGSYFDDKVGAGCVNLNNMLESECITYFGSTDSSTHINNYVYSYDVTLKRNDILQIGLCWFADVDYINKIYKISNFDIHLYNSANSLVCSSNLGNYTCSEFIRYKATSAGTYTVKIYQNGALPEGIVDEPFAFVCNIL